MPSVTTLKPAERAKLEKDDAIEAQAEPDVATWADPIDIDQLRSAFWKDPEPNLTGVLSGDRLRAYHYEVGRMIRPFLEDNLNGASYDLTLGPLCTVNGKRRVLTGDDRFLTIPPNSIAFVTSRELLLIPHWLVARFNLKREFIFDGLLMGAGPQIDPGFMGVLSCPLHNISSQEVELTFRKEFAKLDFVKTTWAGNVKLDKVKSEHDLYDAARAGKLRGGDGEPIELWPREGNFRAPLPARTTGAKSSLVQVERDVAEAKRSVSVARILGAGLVIGFIAVLAALVQLGETYTDGRVEDVRNDAVKAATKRANEAAKAQLRRRSPKKKSKPGNPKHTARNASGK